MNEWKHVVVSCDSTYAKAYLDGKYQTSGNLGKTTTIESFKIGARAAGRQPFNGVIDEVRISDIARSSNWVWACWMNTASNEVFNGYGAVVKRSRGSVMMFM